MELCYAIFCFISLGFETLRLFFTFTLTVKHFNNIVYKRWLRNIKYKTKTQKHKMKKHTYTSIFSIFFYKLFTRLFSNRYRYQLSVISCLNY